MYTPRASHCSLRTRSEIVNMFANYPECPNAYPEPTAEQIDRIRAVQIAGARHGRAGYYPGGDFSSDADWCNGVGAEISALEMALEIDDGSIGELYSTAHSAFFRDGTINPSDRDAYMRNSCFTFHFGAYGDTHVSVWAQADHLEDALEIAAEWLAENAPGHIMAHGSTEHMSLIREACEERGLTLEQWQEMCDNGDGTYADILEDAEADLTYTESGFLTSYEWSVNESDTPPGPPARR